ncbi:GDSL-type esterase/lipase family protein [uncultured Ruminococcus sp.]|uniref:GDSL-type esterase/lipase family protein n=1 Tax=uncultured Ruminococcus sp. TaxID=165186 RepID=UPI0025DBB5A4|nr:GDSL-type esterase/lipase family protein [uncultured Ruminococcus sp.]
MGEIVWTKEYKVERYRKMNESVKKGSVLFAGSSLMEMFPIEQFAADDKLPVTVYNRGIGGFITDELINVIDVCILDLEPSKLFINIGTNDLSDTRIAMSTVMKNYEYILRETTKRVPDVKIYLMAYYPVNPEAATEETRECLKIRSNEKIAAANEEVKKLADKLGAKYIDVNAPLKDEKGRLKAEYTYEGIHIKEEGYKAIYPLVKDYILE